MWIAPLPTHHLPPARRRQDALARGRRQLREIAGEIGGGAHEPARRRNRVRLEIARDDQAPAEQNSPGMAACAWGATCERHVGSRFRQARGIDDLALDPSPIGLAGDRFDDQSEQAVPVIGVFEPRIGLDDRRCLEVGPQLERIVKRSTIDKLAGVLSVADEATAVGEKLGDRDACHAGMQIADEVARRIVEFELALLAQLQDTGRGEAL